MGGFLKVVQVIFAFVGNKNKKTPYYAYKI